ncbi:MAG: ABC transporter substrate-binding protein [Magnetococcales bacterium]|nr:ABC transporter substrate-binding protein [Magnetococcales bacterium]
MNKNRSAVSMIVLFLIAVFTQPLYAESAKVRIGYTPLIYGQPAFVADAKGYFRDEGLDVEMVRFENSTQIVNAMIAGDLDFCAIAPVLAVMAAEEKVKGDETLFKFFYYNLDSKKNPISFLLVHRDSTIAKLSDLKGKTIGVFPGNILSRVSAKLLLKPYVDDNEIKFQDVGPQLQGQALESGQIDAMFSLEPFKTITVTKGIAKVLHVAPQLSISEPLPGGSGFMTTRFVKENPEAARKFAAAIKKSFAYIRANVDEAKKILTRYTPISEEIALQVGQPDYEYYSEMDGSLLNLEYESLKNSGVLQGNVKIVNTIYTP